ncbi:SCO2524 family protein [Phytomonospora sp. NPDC050363]|uniref:SCO2524 family protein n=1 Tax=Phytomonospora sp. NPDC050363 TaxID=3155642 RepID=UPI0033F28708
MRIQPRQHLLEIWEAVARSSIREKHADERTSREGDWVWHGGDADDSVSDTQQLLCLMFPAAELPAFGLATPDETIEPVVRALSPLGTAVQIPRVLTRVLISFLERHSDSEGDPRFSGGGCFASETREAPTPGQRALDVTESFALSITLTLAVLTFARTLREGLRSRLVMAEVDKLEALANKRLTAAMVGLLRSFTVNAFEADSPEGQILLGSLNQADVADRRLVAELRRELRDVNAGLRDLTIGSGREAELEGQTTLFECGWSWGVIDGAPEILHAESGGAQRKGVALDASSLYFTAVALDGIADLFSTRTRVLGLLDAEQRRLADSLHLRWEMTRRYWAKLATFGEGRWPLESMPWNTTDAVHSDYSSLLVSAIVTRDMVDRRVSDENLSRLGRVLTELAKRGRVIERAEGNDRAILLHAPGTRVGLDGADKVGGPALYRQVSDFAAVLLKCIVRVAAPIDDVGLRAELLRTRDGVWDHLVRRRFTAGQYRHLWDEPSNVYTQLGGRHADGPSWHHTLRVVESLVGAAELVRGDPPRSDFMIRQAQHSLSEAEHLYDQELLDGAAECGVPIRDLLMMVQTNLARAKAIQYRRPASAIAIVQEVLRDLDRLAAARQDAKGA